MTQTSHPPRLAPPPAQANNFKRGSRYGTSSSSPGQGRQEERERASKQSERERAIKQKREKRKNKQVGRAGQRGREKEKKKMPAVRSSRNRKPPPEGFEDIEDTLLEFGNKMKDAENASHEGKKRNEVLWPIFQITHQRTFHPPSYLLSLYLFFLLCTSTFPPSLRFFDIQISLLPYLRSPDLFLQASSSSSSLSVPPASLPTNAHPSPLAKYLILSTSQYEKLGLHKTRAHGMGRGPNRDGFC